MALGAREGRIYWRSVSGILCETGFIGTTAHLLKLIARYSGNGRIKTSDTRTGQKLGYLVYLTRVARWIVKVGEMETSKAICLDLKEAGGYDAVFEINGIASNVAGPVEDITSVVGYNKLIAFDNLAVSAESAIEEGREPA